MITRIVRMGFMEDKTQTFEEIFQNSRELIRARQGCLYLSLHQDEDNKQVYYTISRWDSPADLEAYRQSELFKTTWAATKILFSAKPIAYSLAPLQELG